MPATPPSGCARTDSWPSTGPTLRTSMTSSGTGRAPDWRRIARFRASSWVKLPVMMASSVVIGPWGTGRDQHLAVEDDRERADIGVPRRQLGELRRRFAIELDADCGPPEFVVGERGAAQRQSP